MEMKVTYKHFRLPKWVSEFYPEGVPLEKVEELSVRYRKNTKDFVPAGRGGYTTASIEYAGVTVTGVAVCSPSDNFCYRTGREVALDRLTQKLEKNTTG